MRIALESSSPTLSLLSVGREPSRGRFRGTFNARLASGKYRWTYRLRSLYVCHPVDLPVFRLRVKLETGMHRNMATTSTSDLIAMSNIHTAPIVWRSVFRGSGHGGTAVVTSPLRRTYRLDASTHIGKTNRRDGVARERCLARVVQLFQGTLIDASEVAGSAQAAGAGICGNGRQRLPEW